MTATTKCQISDTPVPELVTEHYRTLQQTLVNNPDAIEKQKEDLIQVSATNLVALLHSGDQRCLMFLPAYTMSKAEAKETLLENLIRSSVKHNGDTLVLKQGVTCIQKSSFRHIDIEKTLKEINEKWIDVLVLSTLPSDNPEYVVILGLWKVKI